MNSYRNSDPRPPIIQGSPPLPHLRVPFDSWDRAPWNRWSFQHVRELLPTTEIWRGPGPTSPLTEVAQNLDDLTTTTLSGETITLATLLDRTYTDGFVVLHRGRIVYERLYNGMQQRSLHLSQSMSKSVTGALVGILAGQSVFTLDTAVASILPEFAATAYRDATLRHVLDMTSGVRFGEDYTDPFSDVGKLDVASGWKRPPAPGLWPTCVHDLALTLTELERPHGERFVYRSIETDILAFCIERATGARIAPLVSELIWQPMGAEENACFTVDPSGYALACGGLNATLRDYLRFGAIYLNEGAFNGRQIVPADFVAQTRVASGAAFGAPYTAVTPNGSYRNQFWIEDRATGAIMARGVFGQLIHINPAAETVVAKLSSLPDFINPTALADTLAAIHAIGRALR